MGSKVIVFGLEKMAQLAHFYLTNDSPHEITAFTVDGEFIHQDQFIGLPVVPFEDIQTLYPPEDFKMFIAIGYKRLNKLREDKFNAAKSKGYQLVSYLSSKSSHWGDTLIGQNCLILENQVIMPFVTIGDNVSISSGNHLGHDISIGDHCFLTSHIVVCGGVKIGQRCFIGANVTIRDGVTIGSECIIGAGSLILNDVEDKQVFVAKATDPYPLDSEGFQRMMEISRK
jgi:sugar O-acyltransferase (sialic acid O-acetyltransferase NeuD family)